MTQIRPFKDRLLVKRCAGEDRTPGGILIPDAAKEKPALGVVIAVYRSSADAELLGATVVFSKYAGTAVKGEGLPALNDGEEYLIIKEEDVIGVIQ